MADYIQVFTATEKKKDAERIAEDILEKHLAACVQVLGPMTSRYWWKGKIEEAEEWLCIIKTRADRFESLEKAIKKVHPYQEPEILGAPVTHGSKGYIDWLDMAVS